MAEAPHEQPQKVPAVTEQPVLVAGALEVAEAGAAQARRAGFDAEPVLIAPPVTA